MRAKFLVVISLVIVGLALSVLGARTIFTFEPSPKGLALDNVSDTDDEDALMQHPFELDGSRPQGAAPLYLYDYWVQVNEDGFAGTSQQRQKRAQAMFLQQFEDDDAVWLYCGIEGVNHAEVWRTDGSMSGSPPVLNWSYVSDPVFSYPNQAADYAIVWDKSGCEGLYIGTRANGTTGGTEVLRYYKKDGSWRWDVVNESGFGKTHTEDSTTYYDNTHIRAMAIFTSSDDEECLYVGTFNTYSGCEVWRTDGSLKDGGPKMNWEQVSYGGFGQYNSGTGQWEDQPDNICVMGLIVFNDRLYAGTYNWYNKSDPDYDDENDWSAGRIFRYDPSGGDPKHWEMVWDGVVGGSGTEEDPYCYALAARCFAIFDGKLWVGLFHESGDDFYSSSTGDSGDWAAAGSIETGYVNDIVDVIIYKGFLYASSHRGELQYVWRTSNGVDWERRSRDGFGDDYNKSIYCFGTFEGDLFAATWNTKTTFSKEDGTGCEVWRTTEKATYIDLVSFNAYPWRDGTVLLVWETGTEMATAGFDLYRSETPELSSFEKINQKLIQAKGQAGSGAKYYAQDKGVTPGTLYYYFLVEIDVNGKVSVFGPVQARANAAEKAVSPAFSPIIEMDTLGV